ncbi:MAG: glycosyltransferase family 39 protein [Anaerolineaceae bacterium]|nr:glycosyltransferase family 39 protein [Anaerolineaceae bacterium]
MVLLKEKGTWFGAGLAALAALAAAFYWISTPHGLALVNDTVQYMDGAKNLLQGNGYSRLTGWGGTVPITNFPPFYSLVLAVGIKTGAAPIQAAWWIGLIFLSANVVLVGLLGRMLTGSGWAGLLAGALLILSDPFFRHYLFALTEPVFLFCFFLTLLLLVNSSGRFRPLTLVAAGLFAGLAYLTRYIGITLLGSGLIFLLLFPEGWKVRWKAAGLYLVSALLPIGAWTIRNVLITGNPTNRQISLRSLAVDKVHEGIYSFWSWLLPEPFQWIDHFINILGGLLVLFLVVYLVVVVAAFLVAHKKKPLKKQVSFQLGWLLALQGIVYLSVLAFTILFIDASVNFETRILMPVYNLLTLLFVAGAAWLWRRGDGLRVLSVLLSVGLALSFAEDTLDTVRQWRFQGQGFAHESWLESETITTVKRLPAVDIFTNRPQALNLLADRGSYILLSPINPATQMEREDYPEEQARLRQSVEDGKTVIVIFGYRDLVQDSENEWMVTLTEGLPVLLEYEKDVIFGRITLQ